MTIWFTSDEHYDHRNILGYCNRPWPDVESMQQGLVERHNAVVQPTDTVYHLGDFAFQFGTVSRIVASLHGTHYLIPGNHDLCWPGRKQWKKWCDEYEWVGFHVIHSEPECPIWFYDRPGCFIATSGYEGLSNRICEDIKSTPTDVVMRRIFTAHHLPPQGVDDTDKRFEKDKPRRCPHLALHGHVHGRWKSRIVGKDKVVNVGVDVWDYTPVSLDTLLEEYAR